MESTEWVSVEQLQVGMYVHLDLSWLEHPFSFNNFKIKSDEQLATIRGLGLSRVRYDPRKSDARPLPLAPQTSAVAPAPPSPAPTPSAPSPVQQAKLQRLEQLKAYRAELQRVEQAFLEVADTMRNLRKTAQTQPKACAERASKVVTDMVHSFLEAPEVTLQVMGGRVGGEEMYFHSLNVAILSLMLARELKLDAQASHSLGMGALFHDVGLAQVPDRILLKTEPLSRHEREFREMHSEYGVRMLKDSGLSTEALLVVAQHHELIDGSGYPGHLKGPAIHPLARIVALVNQYDNLCNPAQIDQAMTPYEALSYLYAHQRSKYDLEYLQRLIRCLGVYPPGSIVQLSNDAIAAVIAARSDKPLRPRVVVYDPSVPKEEAIILDLETETDVNITKAIRPATLARVVQDYLCPRKRVSYFFDGAPAPAKA
jgi:putative nucleotidyltransferase with HDIG domain